MDQVALVSAAVIALLLAINASVATPSVLARKGHNPKLAAVLGAVITFAGAMTTVLVMLTLLPNQGVLDVLSGFVGGIASMLILWRVMPDHAHLGASIPDGENLQRNIQARHVRGFITQRLFIISIAIALVALATLLWTIANKTVGLTATQYAVEPEHLSLNGEPTGVALSDLDDDQLQAVLAENVRNARLRVYLLQDVVKLDQERWAEASPSLVRDVLKNHTYDEGLADIPINKLDEAQAASLLASNLSRGQVEDMIFNEVIKPEVVQSWTLWESITQRSAINARLDEKYPNAELQWRSWLNREFITSPLDPRQPDQTGLRPALYGSLMIIVITILVAFPIGVGAAIYLEEYAGTSRINQIIQTNINNLAGVPSIIYGMLGLAIFVRALEHVTSGQAFGVDTANGRTVISGGFTLALLILPLIIINAQEAIRAVPNSLRQASYGLGATQWQTIWHHVLPYAAPGIMTGTILAIARAIGETAPLILVGGATYLTQDPDGPFSIFTALPLLIYRWTTLPQAEFGNAAAAAIVVLLILLLSINSIAVILRNRFSRRLS